MRWLKTAIGAAILAAAACSDGGDNHEIPAGGAGGAGGAGAASGSGGAAGTMIIAGAGGAAGAGGSAGTAGAGGTGGSSGLGGSGGGIEDSGVPDADMPDANVDMTRPPAISLALPTTMENPNAAPWFNVYRPMELDALDGPLPVVVWANGGCFRSDFTWAPLFERWAAGGFIVLALSASPDGGELAQSSVTDHGDLIDWAVAEAEQDGSPYAGKLDTSRIVAAGNSCGGITALGLTAQDDRVASVFVLSGSSSVAGPDIAVMAAISVPVGYVVGGEEDIAAANASADYDALFEDVPAMIVSRSTGDHVAVSTDVMILADVAEIALNWMDLTLYGTPEALEALTSVDVCASCDPVWTLKSRHLDTLDR